jgi:hypothetical protein
MAMNPLTSSRPIEKISFNQILVELIIKTWTRTKVEIKILKRSTLSGIPAITNPNPPSAIVLVMGGMGHITSSKHGFPDPIFGTP